MSDIITYPRMGNYDAVLIPLLEDLLPHYRVLPPPPVTAKTLTLGGRYSPDDICAPFKYNLGGFIESLEAGATLLLQTGTGCRFGYYAAVQESVLRGLGYRFRMLLLNGDSLGLHLMETLRSLGCTLSARAALGRFRLALQSLFLLDSFERKLRERKGFTEDIRAADSLHREFLRDLGRVHKGKTLHKVKQYYLPALERLRLRMPDKPLRVGIVGELYTVMEPSANFGLEDILAQNGIGVTRQMSASYLLFGRRLRPPLPRAKGYLHYDAGATGADSVAQCAAYAEKGCDGVLHLKSYGCAPELNVMPALRRLSADADMPVLHLSFDLTTAETGLQTRLEAFMDMIRLRRDKRDGEACVAGRGHRLHFHQGRGG